MLRKQALQRAIELLSDLPDITGPLQDIIDEMPGIHWTDKKIHDTVQQFIADNGRMPTVTDFKTRGMPSHVIFKEKYGVTLGEWLAEHYPTVKPSPEQIQAMRSQEFVEEYNRIKPSSGDDYNKKRSPKAWTWNTLALSYGTASWVKLVELHGLPSYRKPPRSKTLKLTVHIHNDYDFRD